MPGSPEAMSFGRERKLTVQIPFAGIGEDGRAYESSDEQARRPGIPNLSKDLTTSGRSETGKET